MRVAVVASAQIFGGFQNLPPPQSLDFPAFFGLSHLFPPRLSISVIFDTDLVTLHLESAGILYVFQTFQTAELAEKIRRSAKTQLRGVALSLRQHDMLLFQIVRFSTAADGVLKALRKLAVFRIRYADALM